MAHLRASGDDVVELAEETDITDLEDLGRAVASAQPDHICHLAAQSSVARSWDDPTGTFMVNALGTLNLCSVAQRLAVKPRVLLVSSAEVYGKVAAQDLPVRETRPMQPTTPYAASKASAEMVAVQAWLGRGLEVVRARAFNHTGPGQPVGFVVPDLATQVLQAARGQLERIVTGNLEVSRDIIDVRDVVRAYRLLLLQGLAGEAYNVCGGQGVVISDLLRRLMEIAGADVPVWVDPDRARPAEVPVQVGDPDKIRALCGWGPELSLDQTLADMLDELAR
jgi:GDP-4-dehydro-6-deoxy-D-mannose reductase